jgi:hypothetical protein
MYGGVELASQALGAVLYGLEHVDDMGELADMKYRAQLRQQVEQFTLFGTHRKALCPTCHRLFMKSFCPSASCDHQTHI